MNEVQSARYNEHGLWSNTKPPSVRYDKQFSASAADYGCARLQSINLNCAT